MDTDKLLRENGIGPSTVANYAEVAKFAANLAGLGLPEAEIISASRQFFLKESSQKIQYREIGEGNPLWILGDLGTDIEYSALDQMQAVMRIPPAVKGSLMPDAHQGYAMPIGGVVALENAVSPSFVGYDIACRMTLSILDTTPTAFMTNRQRLAEDMRAVTLFGIGQGKFPDGNKREHPVMEDDRWEYLEVAKGLKAKAQAQLGSSGGGNHFFDALIGRVIRPASWLPVGSDGEFVAIMTHSGSRGTGHNLATHYQRLAKDYTCSVANGVPNGYEWLAMDTDQGREYWAAMSLMGEYARANHHLIHNHFLQRTGISQLTRYENHHNFAWLEDGGVVHRKGATPAQKNQVGIIPGSAGTPSYLVEGLGHVESLLSSSHGAGRTMSRTKAKERHNQAEFENYMNQIGVLHFGIGGDETPNSYKDIRRIIQLQDGLLVRVIAELIPAVVLMAGSGKRADDGD